MSESILKSTKTALGITEDVHAFDLEIMMYINSTLTTLTQLGVGPPEGFEIQDDEALWEDFLGSDPRFNGAKSYTYIKVRMLFDPPTIGFVITALKEQAEAFEWRINALREDIEHPIPDPVLVRDDLFGDPVSVDGGDIDD